MGFDTTSFLKAIHERRTVYQLTNKTPITRFRLEQALRAALEDVPSAFNSQTTRLVLLLNNEHVKFWDIVTEILKTIVPEDRWHSTQQRMTWFRNAYGTILFYEDSKLVESLRAKMPDFSDKLPQWSEHTSAMHQFALWTALEAEGFGANLQHYNPLPDQKVIETWDVPQEWTLIAQLVFGTPSADAVLKEKHRDAIDKKLFIHDS